jgi:uncharacterized membrane protein
MRAKEKRILDFFSHHPSEEWGKKCFILTKGETTIPLCARCTGAAIGIFLSLAWIMGGSATSAGSEIWILLPIPAFVDWIGYNLKGIHLGKFVNAATGILIGFAVPIFYLNIWQMKIAYLLAGIAYAAIFVSVFLLCRKKPASST